MGSVELSFSPRAAIWGLFLIALGGVFLAERYGMIEVPGAARLWPVVLLVIGLTHLVDRKLGTAVTFLLMGVTFLAAANEWWGLDYGTAWPLLMVAGGVGMVIKAFTREDEKRRAANDEQGSNVVAGEVRHET